MRLLYLWLTYEGQKGHRMIHLRIGSGEHSCTVLQCDAGILKGIIVFTRQFDLEYVLKQ